MTNELLTIIELIFYRHPSICIIFTLQDLGMITTSRLQIRKFTLSDAPFILDLLNTQGWLIYIGDKKVYTLEDAKNYLLNSPLKAYAESHYGLLALELRDQNKLIGTCGLLKREYLNHPDIGFALLPEYYRQGYISEAAEAILNWGKQVLDLTTVAAITDLNNKASINLLLKLGFIQEQPIQRDGETINLFQKNL